MKKTISIVLITVGLILLAMGFVASQSVVSIISTFFTGQPSDRSLFLTGIGLFALLSGGVFLIRASKSEDH